MATHESRRIKGWRSRMEEEAAELRRRVWQAPARIVYHEGQSPPDYGYSGGQERWFHREFGEERALARAELKKFRSAQAKIAQSEWGTDQREAYNAAKRAWYEAQSDEWYAARLAQNRAWRARQPPEVREKYNVYVRTWRANQTDEWRESEAAKKRARRAANPELYRAIDQRHELRRRDERNAERRAAYAEAPEANRAMLNARRAAQRQRKSAALAAAPHAPDDPGQKPG